MAALDNTRHPLDHTSWIGYPLEAHAFTVDPKSDYYCLLCHRPRALHASPEDEIATPQPKVRLGHSRARP